MDFLKPSDFKQIKAFFIALKQNHFNLNQIPSFVMMDGARTPIDKAHCLELLHSFPDLSGDKFKDDNALIKYLSQSDNTKRILSKLTSEQQIELISVLEEKPVATEVTDETLSMQGTDEQGTSAQTPSDTTTGSGGMPNLPDLTLGSYAASRRRIVHNVPHALEEEKPPPKLFVADKSGRIVEERTITPTGTTVKRMDEGPSKIYTANKSGVVTGEHSITEGAAIKSPGGTLVSSAPETPSKIFIANKSGAVIGEHSIPKVPYEVKNAAANARSGVERFIQRNSSRGINGLSNMFKNAIGSGGNAAGNAALRGFNSGGNFLSRASRVKFPKIKPSLTTARSKAGFAAGGAGAFLIFTLIFSIIHPSLNTGAGAAPVTGPGSSPAPSASGAPGGGSSDISSCTFYRGGDSIQGYKYSNPLLASLVSDISNKVGVPPAIVAGIMRVESRDAFSSTPDYLTNDYDAHPSSVAFGIMQFVPATFIDYFNRNRAELQSLYNKTDVTTVTAGTDKDHMAPDNVLRIYSIKDSIIATAFKVKNDKQSINGSGPWDEATVRQIAYLYYGHDRFGTTNYTGFDNSPQNYGDDLWKSFSQCKLTSSCPIQTGRITCASYGRRESWSGFDNDCAPGSNITTGEADIGGHCSPTYRVRYPSLCDNSNYISGGNLKRTAKSIDVGGSAGTPVFIPTINSQRLSWFFITDVPDGQGDTLRVFQSEQTPQGKWVIHFVHASADPPFTSGSSSPVDTNNYVARIGPGKDHIHVTVGLNITEPITDNNLQVYDPGWKFPDRDLGMCTH